MESGQSSAFPSDLSSDSDEGSPGISAQYGGADAGVGFVNPPEYDGIEMKSFARLDPPDGVVREASYSSKTDSPRVVFKGTLRGAAELTSGLGYVDLDTQDASEHRTVSSLDSLDGREASPQNQGEETLNYGVIKFGEESGQAAKIRPFITTTADSTVDEIAQWMAGKWRMRSPKVILSVVSGVQHSTIFHNSKFSEDFQKGLTKAANSSVMWVLTDGVDFGAPKLIGDAIAEEMGRRKMVESDVTVRNADKLPKLTLIGVSKKELVTPNARRGSVESMTRNKALNPDHTHFILSDSCSDRGNWVEFHNRVEEQFLKPVGRPRKYRRVTSGSDAPDNVDGVINTTPLVGMVLQGGLEEIDHTLCLLRRRNPVLVIKGSGYAADLIAFAHEGLDERRDADFVSTSLKPELMRKVGNAFPSLADNDALRTLYRDRILECVALGLQDGQTFLTVVDVTQWDTDLTQLSKYILTAIFKSEKQSSGKQLVEHILRDLQLTLDWNLCDLAESVIFEKYVRKKIKVENYLFEQALLRKDREEFVDLFLRYGFRVHKYLNHKRLKHLFENAHDKDLFYGVCMQKILGQIVDPNNILGNSFLEENACQLNRLLFRCTKLRNLVNPYELSMNCLGSYVTNVDVAERKALNTLVLWAAVTHKTKLSKMLWKKVDDPIPMALLLSNLFHSLSKNCLDRDLRSQLKQHSSDFGKMALEILDLSYTDSPTQALDILSKKLPDFDNRTAMELAYIGNNRYFISHKCCQRWLNQRWNGMLLFREMDWGIFSIPQWFKIYLCAFLVFPMYIWLSFLPCQQDHAETAIEVEAEEDYPEKAEKDFLLEHLKSIKERHKRKPVKWRQGLDSLKNVMVLGQTYRPSLSRQIYYLWSAPITKFWIAQLFYLAYLLLFTFALILPTCGNIILDLSVFTWTAIILAELIRFTIIKKQRYPEMPIVYRCFEILLISTFLGFYLLTRIIPHFVTLTGMRYEFTDYQSAKFVMSLGLLFFYYRLLTDCLPISPTLGPMLINIMRMVKKDFSTWFRMFLVFLVSGAVTIHAVIYPNFPVSWEMFRFSFSRALFALFLTKIDDLERDDTCIDQHPNATLGFCSKDYSIPRESTCAYGGWVTYVVVIQYLFIVKLVLTTLLYAMFSTTIAAIKAESTQIWKFQRYTVIVEFEERLRLPPPVIVISYLLILLQTLFWKCVSLQQFCIRCCPSRHRNLHDMPDSMKGHTRLQGIVHIKRTEDFNYWKKCVKVFCEKEDNLEKENNRPKQDTLLLQSLIEDMGNQKRYNRKLNDRLVHLEKGLTNCLLLMEEAKHMIGKLDPKMQAMSLSDKKQVHMYSRQSPYPSTALDRFPVLDKFVTWENVHSAYDPCVFTKPVEEYPAAVQKFVDVDVLSAEKPLGGSDLHTGDGTDVTLSKSESEGIVTDSNQSGQTSPRKPTRLKARWNAVYTIRVDSMSVEVDRTSWISEDGRTCRYRLDRTDLPQNPQGRTGVRGRGVLWRWGPNHCILGVITRCKTVAQEGKSPEVAMKEGKRVLEFVTVQTDEEQSFDFPGGVIHGLTSPYSLLCELFLKSVVMEEDVDSRVRLDKEDMVNFFSQFSADNRRSSELDGDDVDSGFTAEVLYRGYLDDARNTDNAWLETEVWNFHYADGEQLSLRFPKGKFKWQELSSQSPVHDNQLDILREVAKIHSSYY